MTIFWILVAIMGLGILVIGLTMPVRASGGESKGKSEKVEPPNMRNVGEPIKFIGKLVQEEIDLTEWAISDLDNWGYSLMELCSSGHSRFEVRNEWLYYNTSFADLADNVVGSTIHIHNRGTRSDGVDIGYSGSGLNRDEAKFLYDLIKGLVSARAELQDARHERISRLLINKSYGLPDPDLEACHG